MKLQHSTTTLPMCHLRKEKRELLVEEVNDWVRPLQHCLKPVAQIQAELLEVN